MSGFPNFFADFQSGEKNLKKRLHFVFRCAIMSDVLKEVPFRAVRAG